MLGASVGEEIKSSQDQRTPSGCLGREREGVGKGREGKLGEDGRESYTINPK